MKKLHMLCLVAAFLLFLPGCITLQYEEGSTVVSAPPVTNAPVEQTTLQPPTQLPENNAYSMNWSKAEIAAFYNDAVNRAKSNAEPYLMQESISHSLSISQISSEAMRSIAQSVIDKLNRFSDTQYTVADGVATSGGESVYINDLLPPQGGIYDLKETDIAEARASFDGEYVIIEMILQDDTATAAQPVPFLLGGKLPYLSLNGQSIEPYIIKEAFLQYSQIRITAATDTQGRLITVTVSAAVAGNASGGIGLMSADVQFDGNLREVRMFIYS